MLELGDQGVTHFTENLLTWATTTRTMASILYRKQTVLDTASGDSRPIIIHGCLHGSGISLEFTGCVFPMAPFKPYGWGQDKLIDFA